jgi:hypothetical protein
MALIPGAAGSSGDGFMAKLQAKLIIFDNQSKDHTVVSTFSDCILTFLFILSKVDYKYI